MRYIQRNDPRWNRLAVRHKLARKHQRRCRVFKIVKGEDGLAEAQYRNPRRKAKFECRRKEFALMRRPMSDFPKDDLEFFKKNLFAVLRVPFDMVEAPNQASERK